MTTKKPTKTKTKTAKPADDTTVDYAPLAILTADLHLQPCAWSDRPQCRGDAYWAFRQIIQLAKQHEVRTIIAAGDILDTKRYDTATPHDIQQLFAELSDAALCFRYIQGDHDLQDVPWPSLLVQDRTAVLHAHGKLRSIGGVNFYFLDYQLPGTLNAALENVPDTTDVLVMHQTLEELTNGAYEGEMSVAQVPYASMLVIGDIHKQSTSMHKGAHGQDVCVVSPGSICKQAIDESDSPGVYLLGVDRDRKAGAPPSLAVRKLPLTSRATIRYTLDEPADLERILEMLTDDIETAVRKMHKAKMPDSIADRPLIAVAVDTTQLSDWRRLRKAVGGRAELFQQPRGASYRPKSGDAEDPVKLSATAAERLAVVRSGMPAAIRKGVADEKDAAILLRLWQAENPVKELQTILDDEGL